MATPSTSATTSTPAPASSAFPLAAAARFPRASSSTRALALAERRRLWREYIVKTTIKDHH
uniref:Uncharacterized protein n=1 Tax=Oryza meridionalis TaxID=40149 RepID=A0A0E0EYN8_9ORYZ